MTSRDALGDLRAEWLRRLRDDADEKLLDGILYDGRPLGAVAREALKVLAGRLSWPSAHWGTERVDLDAWTALAVAFERAGWTPPTTTSSTPARVIPSRSTDPATSHAAEPLPIRAGTQRHALLVAFGLEAAGDGLTDEEAADLADGVPYRSEFAKRCSELRAAGHIAVVEGVTRSGVAGHQRIVSRITTLGRATLEGLS